MYNIHIHPYDNIYRSVYHSVHLKHCFSALGFCLKLFLDVSGLYTIYIYTGWCVESVNGLGSRRLLHSLFEYTYISYINFFFCLELRVLCVFLCDCTAYTHIYKDSRISLHIQYIVSCAVTCFSLFLLSFGEASLSK